MIDLIEKILKETNYQNNPYFKSLHDGSFDKEDFIETQIQFYFAVVFFNRPMSALAAKIPSPKLRLEVLRNVWEEHGEGNISLSHGSSFLEFLEKIGNISIEEINQRALWPEVRSFNTCLSGACILDDFIIGVGAMGMIERMFCDISSIIGNGIIKRKWLSEEELVHYNVHAELDIKHSEDFFNIIAESWDKSDENKYFIEQGLRLGATIFNNLYKGLYESRSKKLSRIWHGRHSKSDSF